MCCLLDIIPTLGLQVHPQPVQRLLELVPVELPVAGLVKLCEEHVELLRMHGRFEHGRLLATGTEVLRDSSRVV